MQGEYGIPRAFESSVIASIGGASPHLPTLSYNRLDCLEGMRTVATWQLQDAKNRFSAVVDAALSG